MKEVCLDMGGRRCIDEGAGCVDAKNIFTVELTSVYRCSLFSMLCCFVSPSFI